MSKTIAKTKGKAEAIDAAIGARIRECRKSSRVSAVALAEAAGVSLQQLQKYETGRNRVPCGRMVLLARALSKPPSFFFGEGSPIVRYVLALDEGVLAVESLLKHAAPVANDLRSIRDELLAVEAEAEALGENAPSDGP